MNVLVAGGAGYIGSHTVKLLKEQGHRPVIFDNCSRGHAVVARILEVPAIFAELADVAKLEQALREHRIDCVMHFAAYAYVGESVHEPLRYYQNNVAVTLGVLEAMRRAGVSRFVFSSTCATYGDPPTVPIVESMPKNPVSPYGRSKWMVEQVLEDLLVSWPEFSYAALRYFNASGCSSDGTIGEDHDPETHLIPVILQTILGVREKLTVFGTDYPTPDGTNIRDYVHVEDLGDAHVRAMERLGCGGGAHRQILANLGTGNGFSVRQIIETVEAVTGRKVPVQWGPRRAGDAVALWADPSHAKSVLGWEARYKQPREIIETAWRWFERHPRGYPR